MPVFSEAQFGHYKILSQIGAGGMGEIYLAFDGKLERQVALKLLHENITQDAGSLRRFVQEAKSASAITSEAVSPSNGASPVIIS